MVQRHLKQYQRQASFNELIDLVTRVSNRISEEKELIQLIPELVVRLRDPVYTVDLRSRFSLFIIEGQAPVRAKSSHDSGFLKSLNRHLARDGGKLLQEFAQRMTAFQVIN